MAYTDTVPLEMVHVDLRLRKVPKQDTEIEIRVRAGMMPVLEKEKEKKSSRLR
jgi:hypothetical protein